MKVYHFLSASIVAALMTAHPVTAFVVSWVSAVGMTRSAHMLIVWLQTSWRIFLNLSTLVFILSLNPWLDAWASCYFFIKYPYTFVSNWIIHCLRNDWKQFSIFFTFILRTSDYFRSSTKLNLPLYLNATWPAPVTEHARIGWYNQESSKNLNITCLTSHFSLCVRPFVL